MSEGQAAARCGECGMDCQPDEYHPYLACLAFKQTHDSDCVRANVESVRRAAQAAVWREVREKLYADPWPNAIDLRVWAEQQEKRLRGGSMTPKWVHKGMVMDAHSPYRDIGDEEVYLAAEVQAVLEALKECIKTFDYLIFHRTASMGPLLYESHNLYAPERTVEATKRLAQQALGQADTKGQVKHD